MLFLRIEDRSPNLLTCKLNLGLPADDGPKDIGSNTLVNAPVMCCMGVIDQQVSFNQVVVQIHVNISPINLPSVEPHTQTQMIIPHDQTVQTNMATGQNSILNENTDTGKGMKS